MKNTTLGVDPTASSTNSPVTTFEYPPAKPVSSPSCCSALDAVKGSEEAVPDETLRLTHDDLEKERGSVMDHAINDITIPSLRILLTSVLNVIDVAIPNKDQNRAVKRTIREDFDTAYFGILGRAFPNHTFGNSEGSYALSPAPTKEEVQTLR